MNTSLPADSEATVQTDLPQPAKMPGEPALAQVFQILGVLEILGGIVLGFLFWPQRAQVGYEWQSLAYLPAITWATAGVIFGCLFLAVAEALKYLSQISFFLRWSVSFSKADWQARPKV